MDNVDELLILGTLEFKDGAVECYHSPRRCKSRLKIHCYPEKPTQKYSLEPWNTV